MGCQRRRPCVPTRKALDGSPPWHRYCPAMSECNPSWPGYVRGPSSMSGRSHADAAGWDGIDMPVPSEGQQPCT
jgi:hypothetical protein